MFAVCAALSKLEFHVVTPGAYVNERKSTHCDARRITSDTLQDVRSARVLHRVLRELSWLFIELRPAKISRAGGWVSATRQPPASSLVRSRSLKRNSCPKATLSNTERSRDTAAEFWATHTEARALVANLEYLPWPRVMPKDGALHWRPVGSFRCDNIYRVRPLAMN